MSVADRLVRTERVTDIRGFPLPVRLRLLLALGAKSQRPEEIAPGDSTDWICCVAERKGPSTNFFKRICSKSAASDDLSFHLCLRRNSRNTE
jgi:hypothetical protein